MHPVVVLASAKARPALLLPEPPPGIVLRPGEEGPIAAPRELIVCGIVIDCNAPGVRGPLSAAPLLAHIQTASPEVQAQFANAV